MINPLGFSLFSSQLANNSASTVFSVNDARLALANTASADGSPASIMDLATADKALALQGAQAQTNYLVALAMQEGARGMMKKNFEQRRRMQENGAIFF